MCRITGGILEYFLVHPGGPFFKNRESGVWTIPKGLPEEGENLIDTARREFHEETGIEPVLPFYDIGTVKQKSGKIVHAWTFLGDWSPNQGIRCNTFALEWPRRSGRMVDFSEVDKASWLHYAAASSLIIPSQIPFLDRAKAVLCHQT
jgi:predicted NUDIX family NTP pyrophosphohydrolase